MTRATIARRAVGAVILLVVLGVLVVVAGRYRAFNRDVPRAAATPSTPPAAEETQTGATNYQGFLYGRIITVDGATYEGRLRWGRAEEAFWGDYFNGAKTENPWAAQVPPERLPKESNPIQIFGFTIAERERPRDLGRPFMVRFGEIASIEARGEEVRVTLKSGTVFDLDRFDASDFDDDLRVWDGRRGVVDLDSLRIRTIELLPTPALGAAPYRLHGTVRTRQGGFTGFLAWNRQDQVGTDTLDGRSADDELSLRFDTIRSIARRPSEDGVLVTLLDGREIELFDKREVGEWNRGVYVDDRRYGRVLVSWDAFERVDFGALDQAGSGPAYDDFGPGRPLTGSVTTRDGRRLAGRLVYDLDESQTTETLDAPAEGVDYSIPFGLIASIALTDPGERGAQRASVILHAGEELQLERTGDLGDANAGVLIFVDGSERAEYVPWTEVERLDLDGPPAISLPLG